MPFRLGVIQLHLDVVDPMLSMIICGDLWIRKSPMKPRGTRPNGNTWNTPTLLGSNESKIPPVWTHESGKFFLPATFKGDTWDMLVFCKGIIAAPSFESSGRSWQSVGGADTEYPTTCKKVCIDYWHIIQDIDTTPPVLSWRSVSWIPWCFLMEVPLIFFNREKTMFSSGFDFP